MHSTKAKSLFRANMVAAITCMAILLILALNLPSTETMWSDRAWASEQIQAAKTSDQMLPMFQMATSRFSTATHMKNGILGAVWLTGFALCLFVLVNAFSIRRLERQVSAREPKN
jgi:hypothetical protein